MTSRRLAQIYLILLISFLALGFMNSLNIYDILNSDKILQKPNSSFWFGTDSLGRDLFSRMIIGGLVSLVISFVAALGALLLALLVGVALGWNDQSLDRWGVRIMNVYHSIPSFIIASVLCLGFQNTFSGLPSSWVPFLSLLLSLIFTHWLSSARLIRTEIKRMKTESYIMASQSLGASELQIIKMHLALYLKKKMALLFSFIFPSVLFYESFLSFIGFGIQAPLTSWGLLIQEGWRNMGITPHLIFIPMFFVVMTVWSVNVIFSE